MKILRKVLRKIFKLSAILSLALIPSCANVSIDDSFASLMEPTSDGNPNRLFEVKGYASNAENALTGAGTTYTANLEYTLVTVGESHYCSVGYGTATATAITIPASYVDASGTSYNVTSIANNGFNNKGITSFNWNGVTTIDSIGKQAFANNYGLTAMQIPTGPTAIYPGTFENCITLANFSFNSNVTRIWDHAFAGCNKLLLTYDGSESFILPTSLVEVDESAFANCYTLERIVFPSGTTTIKENAFYNCSNIVVIYLASSVINIDKFAFRGVKSAMAYLQGTTIPSTYGTDWNRIDSDGSDDTTDANYYIQTVVDVSSFASQDDYQYIIKNGEGESQYAYIAEYNGSATALTIPDTLGNKTVKGILTKAFYNNDTLTSVTTNASLESIGDRAFDNCNNITNLTLNDGLKTIGFGAFRYLTSLTNDFTDDTKDGLHIPYTVTSIGDQAFFYLNHCKKLYFDGTGETTNPAQITHIGSFAFQYMGYNATVSALTDAFELKIPNSLLDATSSTKDNHFSYMSFNNCKFITTLTFVDDGSTEPTSYTSLGESCFSSCNNLSTVNFGNWVNEIKANCFSSCQKLKYLYIPKTVDVLRSTICSNSMATIYLEGASTDYTSIDSGVDNQDNTYNSAPFAASKNGIYYSVGAESNILKDDNGYYYLLLTSGTTHTVTVTGFVKTNVFLGLTANTGTMVVKETYTSNSVTYTVNKIGVAALAGDSYCTRIDLPNTIARIELCGLYGCSKTTMVVGYTGTTYNTDYVFPSSLVYIGNRGLMQTALKYVILPTAVDIYFPTSYAVGIPDNSTAARLEVFMNVNGCLGFAIGTSYLTTEQNGTNIDSYGGCLYINSTRNTGGSVLIAIPRTTTALKTISTCNITGLDLIKDNSNITSVDLNYDLKSTYGWAFYNDSKITSLILPTTLQYIGSSTFAGCSGLNNVTYRVSNDSASTSVVNDYADMPTESSTTAISNTIISFANNTTNDKGEILYIGVEAFLGCSKITGFILPSDTTNLMVYANAFNTGNTNTIIYVSESYSTFLSLHVNNATSSKNWPSTWANEKQSDGKNGTGNVAYYTTTQPTTTDRKYWHYVSGTPTVWTVA